MRVTLGLQPALASVCDRYLMYGLAASSIRVYPRCSVSFHAENKGVKIACKNDRAP